MNGIASPHVAKPAIRRLIRRAFTAARYEEGLAQARAIIEQYREQLPAAMRCLEQV